jgi:general stress protein YciG
MNKDQRTIIREFLKQAGRKGGKARAAKYDKATLRKWAKKGGRPRGRSRGKGVK